MIERCYEGYKDTETSALYRQITGGVAWPSGANPGWAVVLGQDYLKDEVLKKYHFRVLAESDFINPTDLLRRCFEYKKQFFAGPWYGNTGNTVMMDVLNSMDINYYIDGAPFADDQNSFQYYVSQVRECTMPSKKFLHFGKQSKLPGHLMGLPMQRVSHTKAQDYPAVLSLGYALTGAVTYDPEDMRREQEECDAANSELEDFF